MARRNYREILALRVATETGPEALPAHELARLVTNVENALKGMAEQRNGGKMLPKDFIVALVSIRGGSQELGFYCSDPAVGSACVVDYIEPIGAGRIDDLPPKARDAAEDLRDYARQKGCKVELKQNGKVIAAFEPTQEQPCVQEVQGNTSLLGYVELVGGATPHVALRLHTGERIPCAASEELTRELAHRLYDCVVVEGKATWDAKTGERKSFRAESLASYQRVPLSQAFAELRRALNLAKDEEGQE